MNTPFPALVSDEESLFGADETDNLHQFLSTRPSGWNRAAGACLIDAGDDIAAIRTWLKEYWNSPRTFEAYRKEAERFVLWAAMKQGKTLSEISREDVLEFGQFLRNPDPSWCGPTKPRSHPEWKPFARWKNKVGLNETSATMACTILSNLFSYLVDAGYLQRNPFKLKRGRNTKIKSVHDERLLEHDTIEYLFDWIRRMPRETPREAFHANRCEWIFTLYYYTGARLREIPDATMSDFRLIRGRWWFRVNGKGDKEGLIPMPNELVAALTSYRESLGLSALPVPGDSTPIVCSAYGKSGTATYKPIAANGIYKIIKTVTESASKDAHYEGKPNISANLNNASTHWLRHSSASHQLDAGVPLLTVSQNLRHSQLQTTRKYLHTEDDQRHTDSMSWTKK